MNDRLAAGVRHESDVGIARFKRDWGGEEVFARLQMEVDLRSILAARAGDTDFFELFDEHIWFGVRGKGDVSCQREGGYPRQASG